MEMVKKKNRPISHNLENLKDLLFGSQSLTQQNDFSHHSKHSESTVNSFIFIYSIDCKHLL